MCQKVQLRGTVSTLPHYYHPARLKLTPARKLLSPFSTLRLLLLSRRLKTWPEALQLLPGASGLESAPKSGASQRQHSLEFSIHGLKTQFLGGGTKATGQRELLPQAHQAPASSHWAL